MTSDRTHQAEVEVLPEHFGRLGYLTTAYPHVSHTFIRREILELERLGFQVERFAIREGETVIDPDDRSEQSKTMHLFSQPKLWLLRQGLRGLLYAGRRVLPAIAAAWRLNRKSDRGIIRHLGYLAEAIVLVPTLWGKQISHVHVHFGTNAAAVAYLTHVLGGPVYSLTIHGPDEFDAPIGFSLRTKVINAAFTIAISSYCMSQIKRWIPYEHWKKIHVVGCTVGDEWLDSAYPIRDDADNVVCVGRLSEQKGQLLLIEAFAAAIREGYRGNLVLVGDGPLKATIDELARNLGIESRVEFTGWCDAEGVRDRMLEAKALILPSFAEGLPVVIMEAMALERPVLSTRITGIPELVREGIDGWLVTPGDREALTDALLTIASAEVRELRAMGKRAAQRVRERHSTSTEVGKLMKILESLYAS